MLIGYIKPVEVKGYGYQYQVRIKGTGVDIPSANIDGCGKKNLFIRKDRAIDHLDFVASVFKNEGISFLKEM